MNTTLNKAKMHSFPWQGSVVYLAVKSPS